MRSLVVAVLISLAIILTVDGAYRKTGGLTSVVPGKTGLEFQWLVQNSGGEQTLYMIGDSRVDWGFASSLFERHVRADDIRGLRAVNAGLSAGSAQAIISYVLDHHPGDRPGTLVINFSPASFCHFTTSPGTPIPQLKRQDYWDHQITNSLIEVLYSYGRRPQFLFRHFASYLTHGYQKQFGWFSRTRFSEGFVNAEIRYNDGSEISPDLSYYHQVFNKIHGNPEYYRQRRDETLNAIRKALAQGWRVVLVRFPIGDAMRQLEDQLPSYLQPAVVADAMMLPFLDYDSDTRTIHLPSDESHLTPQAARQLAGILAEDLVPLISPAAPSSDKEPLHIRRAMLEDAETLWNIHRTAIREKASSHYRDSVIRRWLESIPRQDYERLLYERDLFVAEQNDQIVGFGQLNAQAEEIEAMYIDPDVSAPPVAAKLLAHLERVAQRNQISSLKLSAPLYAVETYQRAGYLQEALATYQFSNGPELAYATMRKQLN